MTSKPISTISYNTPQFLKSKLENLLNSGAILDYRYIFHKGEDGDKDHFHVRVEPNKRLDLADLREFFKEIDPSNPKPLGTISWRPSSNEDWIMYVLHDPMYLALHHSDNDGDGKIPYQLEEIVTPIPEQLERDYRKALRLRKSPTQQVVEMLEQGRRMTDIVIETGVNPVQVKALYGMYVDDKREQNRVYESAHKVDDEEIEF